MAKNNEAIRFYDENNKLVVGVKTDSREMAIRIANKIFKVAKSDLVVSNAIIKNDTLYYDGGYKNTGAFAISRKEKKA